MKCYVTVGMKYGDLCSILPILRREAQLTKKPATVLTAQPYAELFEGCSYVDPVLWAGEWCDLRGAVKKAKQVYNEVIVPSTFGLNWPVQKKFPSFQLDQWDRAGCYALFDTLPLVFDRRDKEREAALVAATAGADEKIILFADLSESSPFAYRDELFKTLTSTFPEHRIVLLSTVRAGKPYDLIALYDRADALVSMDTMHLHLSKASEVPTVALVADKPEFWHGTAYQDRFLMHVRYCDYVVRKAEIIHALNRAIAKRQRPVIKTQQIDGYNPCIIRHDGNIFQCWRHHPEASWRTGLKMFDGETTTPILPPERFSAYSIEDGRLFIYKGKLHISYTVARSSGNMAVCVTQYGRLEKTAGGTWQVMDMCQPKYGKNDFTALEKNWSFWEYDGLLYCAYQRAPEQIVLQLDGERVVKEYRTQSPTCAFGQPRGGTFPLPYKDGWIQFFHTNQVNKASPQWWNYSMGALLMDSKPPFQIKAFSKLPILAGDEKHRPAPFYKPKVTIPYGAVSYGDYWGVSVGLNDSACALAEVNPEHLNL